MALLPLNRIVRNCLRGGRRDLAPLPAAPAVAARAAGSPHRQEARVAYELPRRRPRWGWAAVVVALAAVTPAWAQLGARSTEQWLKTLESQNRILRLKVDEVVAALQLPADAVVADIGAGAGAFTLPLARAVTGTGRVYAVDIDQGLVDHIVKKAGEAKLANVRGVLGKFTDPALPARDVDLALIFDVLHHIEGRAEYLRNLAGYLKPGGRIAVIDFYPEIGPHRNEPALQTTKEQTRQWMAAAGLRIAAEYRLYDDKWFVIYAKL